MKQISIFLFTMIASLCSLQAMVMPCPLERAISRDDIKTINSILAEYPKGVHSQRRYGGAMIDICRSVEAMEILIKHGADINKKNKDSGYPFTYYIDKPEIATYMLENGLELNKNDEATFIYLSRALKNPKVFKLLLEKSADHTLVNSDGKNLYHIAARCGYDIKQLSGLKGIDINKLDKDGFPPLYYSIRFRKGVFKELIKNGAERYKNVTDYRMSLYHHIYLREKFDLLEFVPISQKELIKLKNSEGLNPIEVLSIKYHLTNGKPPKEIKDLIENQYPEKYDIFRIIHNAYKKNEKYYDYPSVKEIDGLSGLNWRYNKFKNDEQRTVREIFEEKLGKSNDESLGSIISFYANNPDTVSQLKDINMLETKIKLHNEKFGITHSSRGGMMKRKFIIEKKDGKIQIHQRNISICF